MTHDTFDDELRTLLHDAADAERDHYLDVDPATTLHDGTRVVRRRRLLATAVTSVLALVLGIAGWAALSGSVDRAQQLPATPPPSATGTVSATLWLDDGSAVGVSLDTGTGAVGLVRTAENGVLDRATPRVASLGRPSVTYATVVRDPLVVAGVMPAGATGLLPQWQGVDGPSSSAVADLPGTQYQAFALRAEQPARDGRLMDMYWQESDGVHAVNRGTLPSTVLDDTLVFLDAPNGTLGVRTGATTSVTPTGADTAAGRPPHGGMISGDGVQTFVAVVPGTVEDVSVRTTPDATLLSSATSELSEGVGTAIVVTVRVPGSETGGVAELTWTDGTGSQSLRP